jgi:hypothetical protein
VGWEGEAAASLVGEASDPLDGERRDWPALEGAVRSVAVEADGHADPDLEDEEHEGGEQREGGRGEREDQRDARKVDGHHHAAEEPPRVGYRAAGQPPVQQAADDDDHVGTVQSAPRGAEQLAKQREVHRSQDEPVRGLQDVQPAAAVPREAWREGRHL